MKKRRTIRLIAVLLSFMTAISMIPSLDSVHAAEASKRIYVDGHIDSFDLEKFTITIDGTIYDVADDFPFNEAISSWVEGKYIVAVIENNVITKVYNSDEPNKMPMDSELKGKIKEVCYNIPVYKQTNTGAIVSASQDLENAINDYLEKMGIELTDEADKGESEKYSAEKLRAFDEVTKDKIITMVAGAPEKVINAVYEVYAMYLDTLVNLGVDLGKIDFSKSEIEIGTRLVNKLQNSLSDDIFTGKSGQYTVTFNVTGIWGAHTGVITASNGKYSYTGIINTTTTKTAKIMEEYVNQLATLSNSAFKKAVTSLVSYFCTATGLADFTTKELNKFFKDKIETFQANGHSNVPKNYLKLNELCQSIKTLKNNKTSADLCKSFKELENLYKKIKDIEKLSDSEIRDKVVTSAMSKVNKLKDKLIDEIYYYLYDPTNSNSIANSEDSVFKKLKKFLFECPVEIQVTDKNGNVIGNTAEGETSFNGEISAEINGDVKILFIPDDLIVNLKLTATDDGLMDYCIEQIDENGYTVGRLNYYSIPLVDGKSYTQSVDSAFDITNRENAAVIAQDGTSIIPNEYISVDDAATVKVNVTADEGGMVYSETLYTRGSSVEIMANPVDDFHIFAGWYVDGTLVELKNTYRFCAKTDVTIHAAFKEIKTVDDTHIVTLGDAYKDFASVVIYKNGWDYDILLRLGGANGSADDYKTLTLQNYSSFGDLDSTSVIEADYDNCVSFWVRNIPLEIYSELGSSTTCIVDKSGALIATIDAVPEVVNSIQSVEEILAISKNLNGYYRLVKDIDLSDIENWMPIEGVFTGVLDGNGHSIYNMRTNTKSGGAGLFSKVSGKIRNLNVSGNITTETGSNIGFIARENSGTIARCTVFGTIEGGSDETGGLVGKNSGSIYHCVSDVKIHSSGSNVGGLVGETGGTIHHCSATGNVTGNLNVGGLVGYSHGVFRICFATGDVTGQDNIGGLIGYHFNGPSNSYSYLKNCYATGKVNGNDRIGGLLGQNGYDCIENCYATNNVFGSGATGGLVGVNLGDVKNSFSTGNVFGSGYTGGIVGTNNGGDIENCYTTGNVSGNKYTGGIVGVDQGNHLGNMGIITNCYYNGRNTDNNYGISKTIDELKTQSTYQDWNFESIWDINSAVNNGFPYIRGIGAVDWTVSDIILPDSNIDLPGKGIESDPYLIATANDLKKVSDASQIIVLKGYYKLTADITLSGEWTPIGSKWGKAFAGTFDGGNHTISGIYIDSPDADYVGFFGWSTATIKNLKVSCDVTGNSNVGGLVGRNLYSRITNCYVTGSVNGNDEYTGGLVGNAIDCVIKDCHTTGDVTGNGKYTGGLLGENKSGIVESCSSANTVVGRDYDTGGLIGNNCESSVITNCYSTGNVTGESYTGGLVGSNSSYGVTVDSMVINCYSTSNVTGGYTSIGGLVGYNTGMIETSCAYGKIFGNTNIGGLVGENQHHTITNCYAIGSVNGKQVTGRLVGKNIKGTIANCYAIGSVNGKQKTGGLVGHDDDEGSTITNCYSISSNYGYGISKTLAELKSQETYESWNFADIWSIDSTTNNGFPYLKSIGAVVWNTDTETPSKTPSGGSTEPPSGGNSDNMLIAKKIMLSKTRYVYDGKVRKPTVTVMDDKGNKISSAYYTVSYSKNKKVGKATVTVKLKNGYSGILKKNFTINPKGTKLMSLTGKSKSISIKWTRQKTQTSGYQIQYSTSNKFSKKATATKNVKKITTSKLIVKKLKAKKIYYVRIRTYKTVNGKKYYSVWSKIKKVKTKK